MITRENGRQRGQALVEFVIALPILLFVIFGIIEFARLTFAWMAVQNAARFGIRYAVTGEFKEEYCDEAGNYLGASYVSADTDGGDPQDCIVPDSYSGADPHDLERELIDMARLFSIRDAALGGGTGLWLRPAVSGDYEQYLLNHDATHIGQPTEEGFYHVTICSNRDGNFAVDWNNYAIPLCVDNLNGILMDDAGGPNDRVKVYVEHRHPLFLPLLTNMWSSLTLTAERDGIVEKFRTSRVAGVSGPIMSAPTWTQTPSITPTPTETNTPTATATSTPLPTQFPCAGSGILREYWQGMAGNDLHHLTLDSDYPNAPDGNSTLGMFEGPSNWDDKYGARYRAWLCLPKPGSYTFWIASDDDSRLLLDCSGTDPVVPGDANPGSAAQIAYVNGNTASREWDLFGSQQSSSVNVGKGGWVCYIEAVHKEGTGPDHLAVAWQGPEIPARQVIAGQYLIPLGPQSTAFPTDTPTVTPTPDCSKYSMGSVTFDHLAVQYVNVVNNDVVDAEVSSIKLDWDYVENYGVVNGYPNTNVDLFAWNGSDAWGNGQSDPRDYSSITSTLGDHPGTWMGPLEFDAGSSYTLMFDIDGDWAGGNKLSDSGVISDDFGIRIDFDNGCVLQRSAVDRPAYTFTPTYTPTETYTPTPSPIPSDTPVPSDTPTASNTPLPTKTFTPSLTPSDTPIPTDTPTPSDTPIPSPTFTPSHTPVPSATNTPLPATNTFTPTATPIPTWTPACPWDDPAWPCQPTWTPTP